MAPPPTDWGKNLRCCMVCRLMKTFEQFYDAGCENCPFLSMEGDRERIFDCTSTEFQVRGPTCEAVVRVASGTLELLAGALLDQLAGGPFR